MKTDALTLHSSIKPSLMKRTLFRGTFIGVLGLIPLFYACLFLDTPTLSYWGLPIFFGALALIAFGMMPFRRLTFLEQNPNKLTMVDDRGFIYFHKGKKTLTIPYSTIDKMSYYDKDSIYGIAVCLKKDPHEKITVHNRSFDFERYQNYSKKYYQCDLLLPYFSKRVFREITRSHDD